MSRFIFPIFLSAAAVAIFIIFISPTYEKVKRLGVEVRAFDEALNNSKDLQSIRDKLSLKYGGFSRDDLDRLQKLLPDHVDNIRLIIEIQNIASQYGMILKDVKYGPSSQDDEKGQDRSGRSRGAAPSKNYGSLDLSFSIEGSYESFTNFLKNLDQSLRIVDTLALTFSSTGFRTGGESYRYDFKIRTYWLKS